VTNATNIALTARGTMSKPLDIRPLQPDETERVIAAGLGLARLPRDDGSFYLVAWKGDEPVGHAHLALTDPPELQDVEVLPAHRRRGVATALTRAAEQEALARGHTILTLTVSVGNDAAKAVYDALGYRDTGAPARHVHGVVQIRSGPLEVDDTLLTWERNLLDVGGAVDSGDGRSS
jgi:[ribosomal protein S18]-alanine N-acetyltransferase